MPKLDVTAAIRAGGNKRHAVGDAVVGSMSAVAWALWVYQYRDRATKKNTGRSRSERNDLSNKSAAREARVRFHSSLRAIALRWPTELHSKMFSEVFLAYLDTRARAWKGGLKGSERMRPPAPRPRSRQDAARPDRRQRRARGAAAMGRNIDLGQDRTKIARVSTMPRPRLATGESGGSRAPWASCCRPPRRPSPHDAMPWADLPAFMATSPPSTCRRRGRSQFTIFAAARIGRRASAAGVNPGRRLARPGERMKEGKPYRRTLTSGGARPARQARRAGRTDLQQPDRIALHNAALLVDVRARGYTVHVFRSTLHRLGRRAWLSEPASRACASPMPSATAWNAPIGAPAWSISAGR